MISLEPGRDLAHYRIVGTLGQGGQATAYRADDLRLNRPVVVKALRPELAESETARRRFEREACLCSVLEHPNICAIYDMGEEDGLAYIVMQLVEGKNLKELMAGRPIEALSALSIAVQVADALAVAHAAGIVHRDVKPTNIMVTPAGVAKVLDFGLAKMLAGPALETPAPPPAENGDPMTEIGVPYGSIGYGSPEQAAGEAADHRSDVFSLGTVLYEMFTGQPAFRGKNRLEVLRAVMSETPREVNVVNPKAPPVLQPILARALRKDPEERYQTMAALRDDLKAVSRRLSRDAKGSAEGPAVRPVALQRGRTGWLLGSPLVRVLSRWRAPRASAGAPARPSSWGRETKPTVAVLPFTNLSGDPAASFYELALADGIITELAHVQALVVRPSSYVASYVGQRIDPHQAGADLAVNLVLTGTFLKSGERIRVSAQLLAAGTGEILWSDRFDSGADDVMTLQDAVTERIADGLRLKLSPEEREEIDRPQTGSSEAYEFYLRGRDRLVRYASHTFDEADLEAAIRMFNEAVGLDPDFAAAHAALGRCYVHHAQGYGGAEYYTLAERSLHRALELDPGAREARLYMALVDLHHGDKKRARAAVETLRRETPSDPAVLSVSATIHRIDGLYEEAMADYARLVDADPSARVLASYNLARIFNYMGEHDRAVAELEAVRESEPDHPLVKTFLAIAYFNQGRIDECQAMVEDVHHQNPHFDGLLPVLAWCLSARGRHAEARGLVSDRVREIAAADHDIALWLASLFAMEGLVDEGIEWVRRAVALGNENYPLFASLRKLDGLRGDPRFEGILEELREGWEERRGAAAPRGREVER
jgi:TolB-like protein/tRNA A-37 threonylcarbamoyl transferase component Bud32/Flp pilus assembly protein TadD